MAPFVSKAQRAWMYANKPRMAAEWSAKTPKVAKLPLHVKKKKTKKATFKVDNKLKAFGETDTRTNVVKLNIKKHKGDTRQIADTVKHELLHVKHPKMLEKTVYKKTKPEMSYAEKERYLKKLRMKGINYKIGAIKRNINKK